MAWTTPPRPHSRPFTLPEQSTKIQIYHSNPLTRKPPTKPPKAGGARSAGARPSEGGRKHGAGGSVGMCGAGVHVPRNRSRAKAAASTRRSAGTAFASPCPAVLFPKLRAGTWRLGKETQEKVFFAGNSKIAMRVGSGDLGDRQLWPVKRQEGRKEETNLPGHHHRRPCRPLLLRRHARQNGVCSVNTNTPCSAAGQRNPGPLGCLPEGTRFMDPRLRGERDPQNRAPAPPVPAASPS